MMIPLSYILRNMLRWGQMTPLIFLVGLIPTFFASVLIESLVLNWLMEEDDTTVWDLTWKANQLSYLGLAGFGIVWFVYGIVIR